MGKQVNGLTSKQVGLSTCLLIAPTRSFILKKLAFEKLKIDERFIASRAIILA